MGKENKRERKTEEERALKTPTLDSHKRRTSWPPPQKRTVLFEPTFQVTKILIKIKRPAPPQRQGGTTYQRKKNSTDSSSSLILIAPVCTESILHQACLSFHLRITRPVDCHVPWRATNRPRGGQNLCMSLLPPMIFQPCFHF